MFRTLKSSTLFAVAVLFASYAWGQVEPVGPLTIVPNQPINLFYTNFIPPNPDYKEFQFQGFASVPAGAIGFLRIDFDYVDASGATVIVPAPNSPFTVFGGAPNPIDTGIARLPFCPRDVSLHLVNGSTAANFPIELRGQYRHQCFPVPEPTSFLGSGLLAMFGIGLRTLARKTVVV
jgi:hypothetical protein